MAAPSTTAAGTSSLVTASTRAATACSTSGAGASRRPRASTASARSSIAAPAPPAASGTPMPGAPTATSCSHSSGEKPPARARATGRAERSGPRAPRTRRRSHCCSSLGSRSTEFVYNIRRCSTPPAWRRTRSRGGPPPRPAAIALEHVDGTTLTYAELDRRARAWAGALTAAGVAPGDHVATMVPNTARRPPHAARVGVVARGRGAAQRRVHRPHARVLARPRRRDHAGRRARAARCGARRRGRRPGAGPDHRARRRHPRRVRRRGGTAPSWSDRSTATCTR